MQTTTQRAERRGVDRLRELGAIFLMVVAVPLIASCGGGGGNGGDGGGNGGGGQGDAGGEQANGGGTQGGGTQGGGTQGGENKPPISSVRSVAASPDKKSLDGDRARIRGAEVRNVVSERAFFVGESDAEQLLVLSVKGGVEVTEGQNVRVAGRLSTPDPEFEKNFPLSPEEAAAINEQGIYLRAPQVKPREE